MTSISAERSGLAKVGVTLRRREQWGARRSYTDARSVTEPATQQFIHITVTNPGNYDSFDAHARAIEAIGIARFSATGMSYNRLFMAGTRNVYEAQPIGRRGAHTVNDFRRSTCTTSGCPSRGTSLSAPSWNNNYTARAYAYASNVGFSVPDHVIDDMARVLAADRVAGFVTRNASIHGHRCVSAKSCPGDRVWAQMGDLERRVEHYLTNGLNGDDMDANERKMLEQIHHVLTEPIPPNTGMGKRWPDLPDEGYSPRVYWRSNYGHSRVARESGPEQANRLDAKLDALLAAQEGLDTAAVLERIDQHAASAATERADILALVASVGSGERDAADVVDEIARRLSSEDA